MNFNQDDVYTKNKSMVKIIKIQPTKTKDWNGRFIPSNDIIVDVDGSILIFSEEKLTEMLTLNNYVCGLNDFFKNKEKLTQSIEHSKKEYVKKSNDNMIDGSFFILIICILIFFS